MHLNGFIKAEIWNIHGRGNDDKNENAGIQIYTYIRISAALFLLFAVWIEMYKTSLVLCVCVFVCKACFCFVSLVEWSGRGKKKKTENV